MSPSNKLTITDQGEGNIVECGSERILGSITIKGNHNFVSIEKISNPGTVNIQVIGSNSRIEIGKMRRFGKLRIIAKEKGCLKISESTTVENAYFLVAGANIFIGVDCMISSNVTVRTTDAHGIYDLTTGELQNPPSNIELKDHVWIGQDATVLKGVNIGHNSVVAAGSILSGKTYPDHAIIAGVPGKVIRTGIIWDRRMTKNVYETGGDVDPLFVRHMPRKA